MGFLVIEDGGIKFIGDRRLRLEEHLLHLMLTDGHAEDGLRRLSGLPRGFRVFDAARLAALSGRHLSLDHGGPDLGARPLCFFRRSANAAWRHGDAGG